jgi:acetyl esterase/lipase
MTVDGPAILWFAEGDGPFGRTIGANDPLNRAPRRRWRGGDAMRCRLAIAATCAGGLFAGGLFAAAPAAADVTCGPERARVHVLVIHRGAWFLGDAAANVAECEQFAVAGMRARSLDYPLLDLPAAFAYVERAARVERRSCGCTVVAYGESSGAGMAAWLAAKRLIARAVAWAPVADLVAWTHGGDSLGAFRGGRDVSTLRALSATSQADQRSAPVELVHELLDPIVPFVQSVRAARRWPAARICPLDGVGHLESKWRAQVVRHASKFLRTGRRSQCVGQT